MKTWSQSIACLPLRCGAIKRAGRTRLEQERRERDFTCYTPGLAIHASPMKERVKDCVQPDVVASPIGEIVVQSSERSLPWNSLPISPFPTLPLWFKRG